MKKTTMMRIATTLIVAVLVTTCALGATFAKYVTEGTGSDETRVARWGIKMSDNAANTFVDNYDTGLLEDTIIVAPGTEGGTTYEVFGDIPETDYVISFKGTLNEEVFLAAGAYAYGAPYTNMNATLDEVYNPIKYTVDVLAPSGRIANDATATYNTLEAALEAITDMTVTYEAGVGCDLVITLTWVWDFDDNGAGTNDDADTILGNLAARGPEITKGDLAPVDGTDYNLDINYTLVMTATQINGEPITES